MRRTIFFISDGTGITAETIGHSLMTQFPDVDFTQQRVPFVDDEEKAQEARLLIDQVAREDGVRPIIINTLVDPSLSRILAKADALVLDVFHIFLSKLEVELGIERSPRVGRSHGLIDYQTYEGRMDAMNYALRHDDGVNLDFSDAEVILMGVSRSGKTPTCLYLALHFGVKAANYPLTEDELDPMELPKRLRPHRKKLFGLTIAPDRLQQIRHARRPNSRYSDLRQCQREVADAEALYRLFGIPFCNTTHTSIEEIASKVMITFNIKRAMF